MRKLVFKCLFVVSTTALAFFKMPIAIFALCAVILTWLYDKADSLIEVSFGPLKAKLERNVSEAEKLLNGLRSLSLAQSRAIVAAASHTGRFATNDAWIFHALKDVESGLHAVGASEEELVEMRSSLVRLTLRDLGATATNGSTLPAQLGNEAVREWKEFRRSSKLSDPNFLQSWLSKHDALGPKQVEVLEAMRWISEHKDIRDEAQYLLANQEFELERQASENAYFKGSK